ncbi:glycosyltransferase family 1 protein [Clostridium carnis]
MKNIFIIGSKGIPANYGGFETFVDKLTQYRKSEKIKYHVSCMASDEKEFEYNDARCFNVNVPNIGAAKAVYYDIKALKLSLKYIKQNNMTDCIIYILACRIGPFMKPYKRLAEKMGVKIFVNPDGHEWKRAKWNFLIRKYWKISEKLMVKNADLLVCDSVNIESYIKDDYKKYNPRTTYIAYGADEKLSELSDDDVNLTEWYRSKHVIKKEYYLVVGRFVPENNYELMIREFMKSNTKKDFVIITNKEKNKFYDELKRTTNFENDKRIKFVGTVYDQELLKKIRENAYGYLHGHEVGGTNPSLLEALASTELNILLDVGFNREVGEDGAIYFNKEEKMLANLLDELDELSKNKRDKLANKARERIKENFRWEKIVNKYEYLFTSI